MTDLFGADLPVEGAEGGVFAWRDGPLLQALKAGSWIVLDEVGVELIGQLKGQRVGYLPEGMVLYFRP